MACREREEETTQTANAGGEGKNSTTESNLREKRTASAEKRRSTGPLPSSSDEDDEGFHEFSVCSPAYESVSSPCDSTSSGPVYSRKPGFELHGHTVTVSKSKKKKSEKVNNAGRISSASSTGSSVGFSPPPLDSVDKTEQVIAADAPTFPKDRGKPETEAELEAELSLTASALTLHRKIHKKPINSLCRRHSDGFNDDFLQSHVNRRLLSLPSDKLASSPLSTDSGDYLETSSIASSDGSDLLASPVSTSRTIESLCVTSHITKHKKLHRAFEAKEGFKKNGPTPPKVRPKKEPLPMRLRALPQSFWQQPNVANSISPGNVYPVLPPLVVKADNTTGEVRPVTPPDEREAQEKGIKLSKRLERKVISTTPNTDLLFSLFDAIEGKDKKLSQVKRGRPKKISPPSSMPSLRSDDPLIFDAIQKFPQLSVEKAATAGNQTLAVVSIQEGERSVTLPQLKQESNLSDTLAELVAKL